MHLGVDLDNTIICYDGVFHRVALDEGLIPASLPAHKNAVRDHLRARGLEDRWTELQGLVYGARLDEAAPFPGVREALARCRGAGIAVSLVSHRTRTPHRGPPYDLHSAARRWLEAHGLVGEAALLPDAIHLEETKASKLARIGAAGCTHFLDDLPEILLDPSFPRSVAGILFDPTGAAGDTAGIHRIRAWHEVLPLVGIH